MSNKTKAEEVWRCEGDCYYAAEEVSARLKGDPGFLCANDALGLWIPGLTVAEVRAECTATIKELEPVLRAAQGLRTVGLDPVGYLPRYLFHMGLLNRARALSATLPEVGDE